MGLHLHRKVVLAQAVMAAALIAGCGGQGAGSAHGGAAPTGTAGAGTENTSRPVPKGRPNIVVFQADDQTVSEFNARGAMPDAKRLLADRGTRFNDYIVTTSQCCPSRASLITGQYAHNHGVLSNGVGYPGLVDKTNTLPVWLQQAGYTTIHVGKYLNGYENYAQSASQVAPGWNQWYTAEGETTYYDYNLYVNGGTTHYGTAPADNVTQVVNKAAEGLASRFAAKNRPFYLQIDERAPHSGPPDPFGPCRRAPSPEPRYEGSFNGPPLPRPRSFDEKEMRDKPAFLRSLPRLSKADKQKLNLRWRCVLEAQRGIDRGVLKVYRAIQRRGKIANTVFIYISDNGLMLGEHRLSKGKVLPYEESLRLPLVIRVPKRYRHGSPRVPTVTEPVANIDLAPTILQLAGGKPCPPTGPCRTMDGRSLMPLLSGTGSWPAHRTLLTEYSARRPGRYAACKFAGVRTRTAIYVRYLRVAEHGRCVAADQRERYSLARDPYELHNLCFGGGAGSCPSNAQQAKLARELSGLRHCAGIAGRDHRVDGRPFCG